MRKKPAHARNFGTVWGSEPGGTQYQQSNVGGEVNAIDHEKHMRKQRNRSFTKTKEGLEMGMGLKRPRSTSGAST